MACRDLTPLQIEDLMEGFIGRWMTFSGALFVATKLHLFGLGDQTSATIKILSNDHSFEVEAWCAFPADKERLKLARSGDTLLVEGRLQSVESDCIKFNSCILLNAATGKPSSPTADRHGFERDLRRQQPEGHEQPVEESQASGPSSGPPLPPVPEAALQAWHKAFSLAYPNGSKTMAELSASACFPQHSVTRQRVRELLPDRPMGRPKKSIT